MAGWPRLILATAPIVIAESKLATTDATLALWLFGCQACLWVLGRRPSRMAAALFWVLLSLATLTKGPVGPALIAASSLVAWWWGWPSLAWKRLHWRRGLAGFAIVTAPWFVAISIASGGRVPAVRGGPADRPPRRLRHGGARRLSGLLPGRLGPGLLSVVGPAAGRARRRLDAPQVGSELGLPAGLGDRAALASGVFPHQADPLLPARVSRVCPPGGLAGPVGGRRGGEHQAQAARPPGDGLLVGIGLAGIVLLVAAATLVRAGVRCPMLVARAWSWRPARSLGTVVLFSKARPSGRSTRWPRPGPSCSPTASGWLIPLAEPYRTSRVLGEKLAALSARLEIEPVLLEYQEPGVVYALGHPIATTRDRDGFFAHLKGGRSVLTVALPSEIEVMRSHFGLAVTPVDQVDGFVLTKGKKQTLQLAVVREGRRARSQSPGLDVEHAPRWA